MHPRAKHCLEMRVHKIAGVRSRRDQSSRAILRLTFRILVVLLCFVTKAQAHPNLLNSMFVQFEPTLVRVVVNVSLKEISVAQGVALEESGIENTEALNSASERHRDYVLRHLMLYAGAQPLSGACIKVTHPSRVGDSERRFYQYELEYAVSGPPPGEVRISHTMLNEWPYAAGVAWEVSYIVRAKRSDSSYVSSWLLNSREPSTIPTGWRTANQTAVESSRPNTGRTFREYLWHGVEHILTGRDHLLFVSALVIATLGFWEMVRVIAAFTLAHTITLTLSAFAIFRLPPSIVEPVIALSIVGVALDNVFRPQKTHSHMRLATAFGFGLVHGLGFAGGLLDAMEGLPAISIWTALAAFSLGVEIGHQVVVLPLFGVLAFSRRRLQAGFQQYTLRYGSALISCCGVYYLVAALQEQVFAR